MPRKGKGQKAQAVTDVYGQGIDSIEAQNAIPLPDNRAEALPVESPPGAPEALNAANIPPEAKMQQAMAQAAAMQVDNSNTLAAPTNMPGQPVTSGLPFGAGDGPEALGVPAPGTPPRASVSAFFAIAADVFGQDPTLAQFSSRAQQRGL